MVIKKTLFTQQFLKHRLLPAHLFYTVDFEGVLDVSIALIFAAEIAFVSALPERCDDLAIGNAVFTIIIYHFIKLRMNMKAPVQVWK